MFAKSLIAATFAGLGAATAVTPAEIGSFGLIAINSGSPIQYATINANKQYFWIGKPTLSYCPDQENITCPPGNVTALTAYTTGGVSMDTLVPGGQFVYAAANGELAYTVAHSGVVPAGGISGPFEYAPASDGAVVGSFNLDGKDFFACPTSDADIYQIYADTTYFAGTNCYSIAIATVAYDGIAAWQY